MTHIPASRPLGAAAAAALAFVAACSDGPSAPTAQPAARPSAALVAGGGTTTPTPTPQIPTCTIITCAVQIGGGPILSGRYVENEGYDLVLVGATGTVTKQITNDGYWEYHGALSPDRKKVAFGSTQHGGSVYVINVDGTGRKLLAKVDSATMHHVGGVSWSPDGTKIVYSGKVGGQYDVFIAKADGSGVTKVTNDAANDFDPVFTPDGQQIVVASSRGNTGNRELWRITTAGAAVARLTTTAGDEAAPSFSPDGTKLLYQRTDWNSSVRGIFRSDASGANPQTLVTRPTTQFMGYPSFSPDGQWIAFMLTEQSPPFRNAIWRAALADPATQIRVTPADKNFNWPRWSH